MFQPFHFCILHVLYQVFICFCQMLLSYSFSINVAECFKLFINERTKGLIRLLLKVLIKDIKISSQTVF